jgi:hypothetical protein
MNTTDSFTNPSDNTSYLANSIWEDAGEQVVYNGSGTEVTVEVPSSSNIYWFRSYDYNYNGNNILYNVVTAYDNPKESALPTISILGQQNVGTNFAEMGAEITSIGGSDLIEKGIYWSYQTPVTVGDNKVLSNGPSLGSFYVSVSDLNRKSTIYFVGYATNNSGTILSDETSFDNTPYFTGTGDWNDVNHWTVSNIPSEFDLPIIQGYCTVTSTATCTDLVIDANSSLTINSNQSLTVSGILDNTPGTSGLIVKSGGSLKQNSAVSATVERDISAWTTASHGWHFLSSPVAAQAITSGFTNATPENYDFYAWWEPTNLWVNFKPELGDDPVFAAANVLGVNSSASNFIPGKGYLVAYAATEIKQFQGPLNVSDITVSDLTINAGVSGINKGWHLLGNPFTSALTWGTEDWNLTNINATAKIWNENFASYADYSPILANGIIPALNGFMVEVTDGFSGNNSLTIPLLARTHDATSWYKSTSLPYIKLIARDFTGQTAQASNIVFSPDATAEFDPAFDSHFINGFAPQFYSVADGEHLSTNVLPQAGGNVQIPFDFIKNESSSFTIEVDTLADIFGPVILNDLKTGATQDLRINPVYAFNALSGDSPGRFLLTFSHVGIGENAGAGFYNVYASGSNLMVVCNFAGNTGHAYVYNMLGQLIAQQELSTGSNLTKISMNATAGYYLVKVVGENQSSTSKVFLN